MSTRVGMTIALFSMVVALALEAGFRETGRPLLPGSRVRVTVGSGAVLELERDTEALAIPLARLAKLEVSRGRKDHALNGALIGECAEVALTATLLIVSADDSEFTGDKAVVLGGVLFVLPGSGNGAGIGALIGTGRSESVALPELSGTLAPPVTVRVPVGP